MYPRKINHVSYWNASNFCVAAETKMLVGPARHVRGFGQAGHPISKVTASSSCLRSAVGLKNMGRTDYVYM